MNKGSKIQATPDILEIFREMAHEFNIGVYAETTKEYGEQEQKYIDEMLSFSYKMVQVIGIVAGFGFTAIGFVNNMFMFAIGEALLISSMVYGIYSLKSIYTGILKKLRESSDRKYKILKKKSDLFTNTISSAIKNKYVDLEGFQSKLTKVDQELLSEFSGEIQEGKDDMQFLRLLLVLFATGSLLILLSLLTIDYSAIQEWLKSQ